MKKGQKVRVRDTHWGCRGSTGRVVGGPEKIGRWTYWNVKMTGGRGRDWTMRFQASELEKIKG